MSFFDDIESRMDKQAEADEEARSAEKWEPKAGELLQGVLLSADYPITNYGRAVVLVVRNVGKETSGGVEPGKSAKVWCGTMLHSLVTDFTLNEAGVPSGCPRIGKAVAIRFEGERENKDGSNTYKAYTFMREEADPEFWRNLLDLRSPAEPAVGDQAREEPEGGFF